MLTLIKYMDYYKGQQKMRVIIVATILSNMNRFIDNIIAVRQTNFMDS